MCGDISVCAPGSRFSVFPSGDSCRQTNQDNVHIMLSPRLALPDMKASHRGF